MPRPRQDRQGLTRGQVARRLGFSVSYVRKLERQGRLRGRKDPDVMRFDAHAVAELAIRLGRRSAGDQDRRRQIAYEHFVAPGFEPTVEAIGRIVIATGGEAPETVLAWWSKYKRGAGLLDDIRDEREQRRHEAQLARYEAQREASRRRLLGEIAISEGAEPRRPARRAQRPNAEEDVDARAPSLDSDPWHELDAERIALRDTKIDAKLTAAEKRMEARLRALYEGAGWPADDGEP